MGLQCQGFDGDRGEVVTRVLWPFAAVLSYLVAFLVGMLCLGRLARAVNGIVYGVELGDVFSSMTRTPVEIAYFEMIQGAVIAVVVLARLAIYRNRLYPLISSAACGAALLLLHYAVYRLVWRSMNDAPGALPWWVLPLVLIVGLLMAAWLLFRLSNRLFAWRRSLWFSLASSGASWIDAGALLLLIQLTLIFSACGGNSVRFIFGW